MCPQCSDWSILLNGDFWLVENSWSIGDVIHLGWCHPLLLWKKKNTKFSNWRNKNKKVDGWCCWSHSPLEISMRHALRISWGLRMPTVLRGSTWQKVWITKELRVHSALSLEKQRYLNSFRERERENGWGQASAIQAKFNKPLLAIVVWTMARAR